MRPTSHCRWKWIAMLGVATLLAGNAAAQEPVPVLVKDIIPGGNFSGQPRWLAEMNGQLFFTAISDDGFHELWRSDGTEAGTVRITAVANGGPANPHLLTAIGGTLFFAADHLVLGRELWKSDGTAAGTVLVKDISQGGPDSVLENFTVVDGTLYFSNQDQVWRSDGTDGGTVLLVDFSGPGRASTHGPYAAEFTNVAGTLFFSASTLIGLGDWELWKSDGTPAGTVRVKGFEGGPNRLTSPNLTTALNGVLYFAADDGVHGIELWKSDGTEPGTILVEDIRTGEDPSFPQSLITANGSVFFIASQTQAVWGLWKSDGTAPGTGLVKSELSPGQIEDVNGMLFIFGSQLWKSDGTTDGTLSIATFVGAPCLLRRAVANGIIFFVAREPTTGCELWKSNGTSAGTVRVADLQPGSSGSDPDELTIVGNTLFFAAFDTAHGFELWKLGLPPADTDTDGLPNDWELRFGLDPASPNADNGPSGDPDADGQTNLQEFQSGTHPRGLVTRYLAEGATGPFFDASIALVNPNPTATSTLLRFNKDDGTTITHWISVPSMSRVTVDAESISGLDAAAFATVVESDVLVVVDRTMRWDAQGYGAHAETAVLSPAMEWFLAEGATHSGFSLFYLLQNPNAVAASATVTYLRPSGLAPVIKVYTLPPRSRTSLWVNLEDAELASTDVSAVIAATQPIIVERAMYRDAGGLLYGAGHESAGLPAPSTSWFLAEGATGPFFDLFVLIANPTASDAAVTATYLLPTGQIIVKNYGVAANSRFNIWVDLEGAELADTAVSTTITVTNGVPVIVERSMWWPGGADTWIEAHNSPGATATGAKWALAEGELGGASAVQTYILLANTSANAGDVKVTLLLENGGTLEKTFPVAGNSRFNVSTQDEFPAAINQRFGAVIESIGATPLQLVVERAMYSNAQGLTWAAGTNAVGTRLP